MKNAEKKIPETAPSKSVQRRIKEQTGHVVPLSESAARGVAIHEALAEHFPPEAEAKSETAPPVASAAVKDALRAGKAAPVPVTKTIPTRTPILGLLPTMNENALTGAFRHYQEQERNGAKAILDKVTKECGAAVAALDKLRSKTFEAIKIEEDRKLQEAQKTYQQSIRTAKSALDRDNALVANLANAKRVASREIFVQDVEPINARMETTNATITADYTAKMVAAVAELQPVVKVARETEAKRVAALKAKMEADAAAKAELLPPREPSPFDPKFSASPHFVGASTAGAAA